MRPTIPIAIPPGNAKKTRCRRPSSLQDAPTLAVIAGRIHQEADVGERISPREVEANATPSSLGHGIDVEGM